MEQTNILFRQSKGINESENYLGHLCRRSFLSLWSYINPYRKQGKRMIAESQDLLGDGKELCDLLVVFDNHVIIFSDKSCKFPNSGDNRLDWSRWYKRAVLASANQIYGAERWIEEYPNEIFLDKCCTNKMPIKLADRKDLKFHRIVVAHGASKECISELGGSGSLMVYPSIIGDDHYGTKCMPFAIGIVDQTKGYIHVFDDYTLDVILKTLDTISDFVQYLLKKEAFICSGDLAMAAGEDDLLGYYLSDIDETNQHTFYPTTFKNGQGIIVGEGVWEKFCQSPQRMAQVEANKISYLWDGIIERFSEGNFSGTSCHLPPISFQTQELLLRLLAKENRTHRRFLSRVLLELISSTPEEKRCTRIVTPLEEGGPFYLFTLLPRQKDVPTIEYEEIRVSLLQSYLQIIKHDFPDAVDIIGYATETGLSDERTEHLAYLDTREWTDEQEKSAIKIKEEFIAVGLLGKQSFYYGNEKEYPDVDET